MTPTWNSFEGPLKKIEKIDKSKNENNPDHSVSKISQDTEDSSACDSSNSQGILLYGIKTNKIWN